MILRYLTWYEGSLFGTIVTQIIHTKKWLRKNGPCDEIRLSVEFVNVGVLGICRQYCCDLFPMSWRADEATPERGTPIVEKSVNWN